MIQRTLATAFLALLIGVSSALAGSIDTWISDLKNQDPAVRAKAAYELGCT